MLRIRALIGIFVAAFMLAVCGAARAQSPDEVTGPWHGVLTLPGSSSGAAVVLTIARNGDGTLAAIFGQAYSGANAQAAVSSVAVKDDVLTFAIARANASFEGKWNAAQHRWDGTFKQGSLNLPLVLEPGKPPARPFVAGMDGAWQGVIERNGAKLRLVLRVATADYGTIVTLDSPDQLSYNQDVPVFSRKDTKVALALPATGASYEAALAQGGAQMTGIWKRPGQPDASVTFTRSATPVAQFSTDRPQTPKPPFDYRVENVTFENPEQKDISLAGTLTLPKGNGPFPAAILISGSGANDRDDTALGHKPFAVIADHLTRHGFAVLRYDDRGVGGSKGDHDAADSVDFASDANAAARFLMSRPDIRHDAIGFIVHSEGGVTGPLAMASNKQVAFLVMLGGPGVRWDRMLLTQIRLIGLSRGKTKAELDRAEPKLAAIYRAMAHARSEDDASKAVAPMLTPEILIALGAPPDADREQLARQMSSRWARYLFGYDPATNLKKIRVPVLAMTGSLDVQIPAKDNLPAIKAALAGDRDVTVKQLPGLNHLFQTAKTGAPGEYADIQETFAPAALDLMTDWLVQRFARPSAAALTKALENRKAP